VNVNTLFTLKSFIIKYFRYFKAFNIFKNFTELSLISYGLKKHTNITQVSVTKTLDSL